MFRQRFTYRAFRSYHRPCVLSLHIRKQLDKQSTNTRTPVSKRRQIKSFSKSRLETHPISNIRFYQRALYITYLLRDFFPIQFASRCLSSPTKANTIGRNPRFRRRNKGPPAATVNANHRPSLQSPDVFSTSWLPPARIKSRDLGEDTLRLLRPFFLARGVERDF